MKKLFASIYQYYLSRKLDMPYFRSIITVIGFLIMGLSLLFLIFPLPLNWNPFGVSGNGIINYLYGGIFIGLLYFVFLSGFYKEEN
jgi:hypothetical protein